MGIEDIKVRILSVRFCFNYGELNYFTLFYELG